MSMEEYRKQKTERLDNLTVAVKSLDEAMECIRANCRLCAGCSENIKTVCCKVDGFYNRIKKAKKELIAFICELENRN